MSKVQKNPLEWTVFALSLVLVTSVLGSLIYWLATQPSSQVELSVQLGTPSARLDYFAVPVTAVNLGEISVEGAMIVVTLIRGDASETSELEFDYLPHGSQKHGEVLFESDPATADSLSARVTGYRLP